MPDFLNAPLNQYLNQLASGAPTPGGGSAAGLNGAMAAALLAMSAQFTLGRERYREYQEAAAMVLTVSERLRDALQHLIEEDADAYAQYGAAMALPKGTDEEKAVRHHALQEATRASAQAPMSIARHCHHLLELAGVMAANCNPNLVSDVAVAVELAHSAFRSAVLNVRLNLRYLEDTTFVQGLTDELSAMIQQAPALMDSALCKAYQAMNLSREGV